MCLTCSFTVSSIKPHACSDFYLSPALVHSFKFMWKYISYCCVNHFKLSFPHCKRHSNCVAYCFVLILSTYAMFFSRFMLTYIEIMFSLVMFYSSSVIILITFVTVLCLLSLLWQCYVSEETYLLSHSDSLSKPLSNF